MARLEENTNFPRRGSSLGIVADMKGSRANMEDITTFSAPGWKTDVKLVVFHREFHVHSLVLRLYSGFFRKAFDLDDENPDVRKSAGGRWRYEFVILGTGDEIAGRGEEGLGWTMERFITHPRTPSPSPDLSPTDQLHTLTPIEKCQYQDQETETPSSSLAFNKLICAYYNKPFSLTSFSDLQFLTQLANHFSSLPILSSSLYISLWYSPHFIKSIRHYPHKLLLLATKLRHKLLFKEALIHVVRTWKGYDRELEGEYRLICTVQKAWNGVCERVVGVNEGVFGVLGNGVSKGLRKRIFEVLKGVDLNRREGLMANRPFYEELLVLVEREDELEGLREGLRGLLVDKLVLEKRFGGGWGGGDLKEGFLCAEIEDRDLPWNLNEEDW